MNEKDLVRHLSNLSGLKPDNEWVKKNREVLSYQIFNGQEYAATEVGWFAHVGMVMQRLMQPAPIAALIILFFAVSGVIGMKSAGNATPSNRVLYIAKILNEKANLATTFDEKGKLALTVDYAQNRVTELEEISKVTEDASDPRIQELTNSFKQEIASARERLNHLNADVAAVTSTEQPVPVNAAAGLAKDAAPVSDVEKADTENDDAVVSADDIKKEDESTVPTDTADPAAAADAKETTGAPVKATDTTLISPADAEKLLTEVEQLVEKKNYKEAASKLGGLKIK